MVGLVVAGPWLTMVGARLIARRASRPATLIAARRLADDPKAGFRAVSGADARAVRHQRRRRRDRHDRRQPGYPGTDAPTTANLFMVFWDEETAPTGRGGARPG